jgi:two-component system NarL family sensor kinase
LSYLFHPPSLGRLEFIPALKSYLDGFAKRSGIDISLYIAQNVGRLPVNLETDLFRVVQEALYNVFRHSGSRRATVLVQKQLDQLLLQIKVAGHGLRSPSTEPEATVPFGIGIPSMKERLRRWGGQLQIESTHDGVLLVARIHTPTVEI